MDDGIDLDDDDDIYTQEEKGTATIAMLDNAKKRQEAENKQNSSNTPATSSVPAQQSGSSATPTNTAPQPTNTNKPAQPAPAVPAPSQQQPPVQPTPAPQPTTSAPRQQQPTQQTPAPQPAPEPPPQLTAPPHNQAQPDPKTGNPPPNIDPPAKTNSTIEWIKNNPGTSLGLVALLGITGYLLYKRRKKKQKEAEEMAKESSFYLNQSYNGLRKLASGKADSESKGSFWDQAYNALESKIALEANNRYNNFVKENPYVVPGTIAAGTGLLSTAASGKASTGLTTALGAIGGWAGGNYLYNNYAKDIEGWVGRNLGEKAVPFTQAATPIVGALAGSLLGAAFGN